MSRESTASLSVVPVAPLARLCAPEGLTPDESALWRRVVDARPADYFGEDCAPLLTEYVRGCVMADALDALAKAALAGGDVGEMKGALQLRDMESRRITSIATKLRITNQARYTPQAAATASKRGGSGKLHEFGRG